MARARRQQPPDDGHLAREASWAGLRAGDPVDVLDERARGGTWRFVAHVTNRVTQEAWVEVVGGRHGDERLRAFRTDQLYPAGTVRRGGATAPCLEDAPRLPMDASGER